MRHILDLLKTLVQAGGKVLTHQQLLQQVWAQNASGQATCCMSISATSGVRSSGILRSRSTSSRNRGWATGSRSRSDGATFALLCTASAA